MESRRGYVDVIRGSSDKSSRNYGESLYVNSVPCLVREHVCVKYEAGARVSAVGKRILKVYSYEVGTTES